MTGSAAGGVIARDLFQQDGGGWFEDAALSERLVREKLESAAEAVRAGGWRWVETAPSLPFGHIYTLRRIAFTEIAPSEAEQDEHDALRAEYEALEAEHMGAGDDLPEEVDARLVEVEAALSRFEERPRTYDPNEVAHAFVSLDHSGALLIERGYVRPEDESPTSTELSGEGENASTGSEPAVMKGDVGATRVEAPDIEEDGIRPLPERLVTELTTHRTLALRNAVANDPEMAVLAALHALALKAFYRFGSSSCL